MHKAIVKAERLICITGWSVWIHLRMLRGEDARKDVRALGELLVDKANEGVAVYMMVWSDFSNIMGTHDDETKEFFKNSKVHFALVPRELAEKNELTDHLQNSVRPFFLYP